MSRLLVTEAEANADRSIFTDRDAGESRVTLQQFLSAASFHPDSRVRLIKPSSRSTGLMADIQDVKRDPQSMTISELRAELKYAAHIAVALTRSRLFELFRSERSILLQEAKTNI